VRADLVPELGLDLVEMHRQLAVAANLAARHIGDDLLVRRAHAEVPVVAVLDPQQLGAVLLPTPGLLPQLGRLHRGHEHLEGAGAVHLLAHDGLDLAHNAQAERHPGIDPSGQPADHSRADHQLVADQFRVGGSFLEGCEKVSGSAHSAEPSQTKRDILLEVICAAFSAASGLLQIAGDL
jgi:hypothetical protein